MWKNSKSQLPVLWESKKVSYPRCGKAKKVSYPCCGKAKKFSYPCCGKAKKLVTRVEEKQKKLVTRVGHRERTTNKQLLPPRKMFPLDYRPDLQGESSQLWSREREKIDKFFVCVENFHHRFLSSFHICGNEFVSQKDAGRCTQLLSQTFVFSCNCWLS